MSTQTNSQPTNEDNKPSFEIQRLYVKEISCKVPHAPQVFSEKGNPEVNFELDVKNEQIEEGIYQVLLRVHVTSKIEQRTALLLEVAQAGVFKLNNLDENTKKFILNARCAAILSGYARKVIADAATEAGFGPIHLSPIDFEGLYMNNQDSESPKSLPQRTPTKLFETIKKPTSPEEIN